MREFFTGGPEVQSAKQTIKNLDHRRLLSAKNRQSLQNAHQITRRHFLTRQLPAIGVATLAVTTGTWSIFESIPSDEQNTEDIRRKISTYEDQNQNNPITEESLQTLTNLISNLYESTFKKKTLNRRLFLATNEFFKKDGLKDEELPDFPSGDAGFLLGRQDGSQEIPIIIFEGKPGTSFPGTNQYSLMRAIIMHEFIHAQTTKIPANISIGSEHLKGYKRGLKFTNIGGSEDERGHFFEEWNTQLLTEEMNDPTGIDNIFKNKDKSLDPLYLDGADLLRRIYKKLGITLAEIEDYHYKAEPLQFVRRIEAATQQAGIKLPTSLEQIFFAKEPSTPTNEEYFKLEQTRLENLRSIASAVLR